MSKESRFFNVLKNIFVGVPVEGESGYINLMRIGFFFTPYHQSVYERVYTDDQDVILFWFEEP